MPLPVQAREEDAHPVVRLHRREKREGHRPQEAKGERLRIRPLQPALAQRDRPDKRPLSGRIGDDEVCRQRTALRAQRPSSGLPSLHSLRRGCHGGREDQALPLVREKQPPPKNRSLQCPRHVLRKRRARARVRYRLRPQLRQGGLGGRDVGAVHCCRKDSRRARDGARRNNIRERQTRNVPSHL